MFSTRRTVVWLIHETNWWIWFGYQQLRDSNGTLSKKELYWSAHKSYHSKEKRVVCSSYSNHLVEWERLHPRKSTCNPQKIGGFWVVGNRCLTPFCQGIYVQLLEAVSVFLRWVSPRPSHPLTRIGTRHGARLSCCTKAQGPNDAHRRTKSFTQILPCIGQADIFLGHFLAKAPPKRWEDDVPGKWLYWLEFLENNKAGETQPLLLLQSVNQNKPAPPSNWPKSCKKKHLQQKIDRCFWGIFLMQDLCWITLHNFISENNPLRVLALRLLALKKIKPFLVAQPSFGTWFAIETLGKHSHHKGIDHLFRDVGSKPLRFVENSGNFLWRLCRFCCDTTSCRPPFGSICQHESVKICQILSFFWKKNEDDHHLQWPFAKPQWDGWIWNGNLSNVKQNPCDG